MVYSWMSESLAGGRGEVGEAVNDVTNNGVTSSVEVLRGSLGAGVLGVLGQGHVYGEEDYEGYENDRGEGDWRVEEAWVIAREKGMVELRREIEWAEQAIFNRLRFLEGGGETTNVNANVGV